MHYVIELHYDPQSEEKLRDAMALCGYEGKAKPHITLVSAKEFDVHAASADLARIFGSMNPQIAHLSSLGLFPFDDDHKIFHIGIAPSGWLCRLQQDIYDVVQRHGAAISEFSRPDAVMFHSTLSMKMNHSLIMKAIDAVKEIVPCEGKIIGAAVVEYPAAKYLSAFQFLA